jgi:hypothetical protein
VNRKHFENVCIHIQCSFTLLLDHGSQTPDHVVCFRQLAAKFVNCVDAVETTQECEQLYTSLVTIFQVRSANQPILTPVDLYHKMVGDNDGDARLHALVKRL